MKRIGVAAAVTVGLAGLLCAGSTLPASAAPPGPTTVVSGLVGPLHLTWSDGSLLVADSFGGQIVRADPATGAKRVLASHLNVSAVTVGPGGGLLAAIGEGVGARQSLSRVASGTSTIVADLLAFEKAHNPDGQPQRPGADSLSNPYDALSLGNRTLVADAGANDVLTVRQDGQVSLLTALPVSKKGSCAHVTNNGVKGGGCDPVPTALAIGPDGYLYVSGLGAEVEGHVWKIDQSTGAIVAQWDGFPPLTGIAVGNLGAVYVSSLFADTIYRLGPTGVVQGTVHVTGPTGLSLHGRDLYAASVKLPADQTTPPVGAVIKVGVGAFFGG